MKGRESGMPEEPVWDRFFDASELFDQFGWLALESDVVEFGCGYGTFTVEAARRTRGRVFAIDIEPEMVAATRLRSEAAGVENVICERRDFLINGCGRPDESVGGVLLFNILHIESPVRLLTEAFRVLQSGGAVAIIHWNYDATTPRGPSMAIRPRPEACRAWGEQAGFEFVRDVDLPECPFHYGLLLRRPIAQLES